MNILITLIGVFIMLYGFYIITNSERSYKILLGLFIAILGVIIMTIEVYYSNYIITITVGT